MATTQPIIAQLDNSTNIEEEESVSRPVDTINVISMLLFVIALFSIGMTARKKKKWKLRNVIALAILFISIGAFISSLPDRPFKNTNVGYDDGYRALAIFLVIIALAVAFIPKRHRTEKSTPWKKRNDIRRQFPIQIRDQVLKGQKHSCANCGISISPPLIHYDHIDGNHFNIEISNCQALCPNCHSLKTDDDRRNQRSTTSFKKD
jgi:hypothetical protein